MTYYERSRLLFLLQHVDMQAVYEMLRQFEDAQEVKNGVGDGQKV